MRRDATTFGQSLSAQNSWIMQFALKFYFFYSRAARARPAARSFYRKDDLNCKAGLANKSFSAETFRFQSAESGWLIHSFV